VAAVPHTATLAVEYLGPGEVSNIDAKRTKLYRIHLDKHGKVVAKIVYLTPVLEPDPDFTVEKVLVFGRSGMPRAAQERSVAGFLWSLHFSLRHVAVAKFEPLFL
jgi:hypothetical protein